MTVDTLQTMRELDRRHIDGIHVRLLWSETDNRVAAAVADTKTGGAFVVEVRNGDSAFDVFHHSYAYAAWQRVDTRGDAALAGVALASA
jgi:hypothetical protein